MSTSLESIHQHYQSAFTYEVAEGPHVLRLSQDESGRFPLTADVLLRMIDPRDSLVVTVLEGFYPLDACQQVASQLADVTDRPHGAVPGLKLLNAPSFFGIKDESDRERYYEFGAQCRDLLREFAGPFDSPFDVFTDIVDDAWPSGLGSERLRADAPDMAPFTVRHWIGEGGGVLPHVDRLSFDTSDSEIAAQHAGQLGFNLVMSAPRKGGETIAYNKAYVAAEAYDADRDQEGGGYNVRAKGFREICRVRAPVGSALLMKTQVVHAVLNPEVDDRITISGFISVPCDGGIPLGIWG